MFNNFKAQVTTIVIVILALIIIIGGGYLFLQNRSQKVALETTTTLSTATTQESTTTIIEITTTTITKPKITTTTKPKITTTTRKITTTTTTIPQCVPNACLATAPNRSNYKCVFVTSVSYSGNLGGLTGADAKCQAIATQKGFSGTYKAWLSDSTTAAKTRLSHSQLPYRRPDCKVIANNWNDLIDGKLLYPIEVDENNELQKTTVWTNTKINGDIGSTDKTCSDWMNESKDWGASGHHGKSINKDNGWTDLDYIVDDCKQKYALYCIEQ